MVERWALQWYSKSKLDGIQTHIIMDNLLPKLFVTRSEARIWAKQRYGHIAKRRDLRADPYGWRVPKPIRVSIELSSNQHPRKR